MSRPSVKQLLINEISLLFTVKSSTRPWYLPLLAAITISAPIFFGAFYDQLAVGLQASLGAMVILNLPNTGSLRYRQLILFYCAIAMSVCFGLGLLAQNVPVLRLPIFAMITFTLVISGRYWRLPPPAGMFMMMAAAIALFIPIPLAQIAHNVGIIAAGSGFAWLMALLYNRVLIKLKRRSAAQEAEINSSSDYGYEPALWTESIIVTSVVTAALAIALYLGLSYPYWVPVSCFIIMQGMHLRTIWIKQLHRLLGTAFGVFIAWFLLSLSLSPIGVAAAIFLMMFWIETMVVRHYGLAVLIITPLTIFIAEFGRDHATAELSQGWWVYQELIQARFFDTALGCLIALAGGLIIHSRTIRRPLDVLESKMLEINKRR